MSTTPKKKTNLFEKAPKGFKWRNVRTLVKDEKPPEKTEKPKEGKKKPNTKKSKT